MAFARARVALFCRLVLCLTLFQMTQLATVDAKRRPFYVIGNMVNSLHDVDDFLNAGANALQADVQFSPNGRALYFYHGKPCDCDRTCTRDATILEYLNYVRALRYGGKFKGKLALLYLALKTSKLSQHAMYRAGVDIARKLMGNLWRDVSPADAVPVLLYVRGTYQMNVFKGVLDTVTTRWRNLLGDAFAKLNITGHRWLGSGTFSCESYKTGQYKRLQDIVDCREGHIPGCNVDKGYAYNLDRKHNIAREIRLGLDALITNRPSTVREVLESYGISSIVRLANTSDSPWERVMD
ncbi:dermonecrotic toxin SPH-like isoform X2 [Haemaphysalis longicornis]